MECRLVLYGPAENDWHDVMTLGGFKLQCITIVTFSSCNRFMYMKYNK